MENIKKIGIMSDSHDNLPAIRAAVKLFNSEGVDLVIHAGDLVAPFTARELKKLNCPYEIILGNNDGEILGLNQVYDGRVHIPPYQINVAGKSILVLHDQGYLQAIESISGFDLIIYGHDHKAKIQRLKDGTLVINPGECGGWLYGKRTVAIYDSESDAVRIYELYE